MRERDSERVVLVHVNFPTGLKEDLEEFKELACSAGAKIVAVVTGTRRVPDAKYFVGSGKAAEIAEAARANDAELILFNHVLSPAQERNVERLTSLRVLDRTGLILDIFSQRARSFEGKMQVELAQLKHLATRLVRGWTHLERQRGGIGLRGPGETQLESDRRLIRNRIKVIDARLVKLSQQRELARRARRKAVVPTVALVGYTNAGKSTLFNYLTGANVYVANQLFATLDPTLRRVELPEVGAVILADTVGFIRHLPHDLIKAFHATLEEVSEANLLLHVIDTHDPLKDQHIEEVEHVLNSIEASGVPTILVYNKIDLCESETMLLNAETPERDEYKKIKRVFISAKEGKGFDVLAKAIAEKLQHDIVNSQLVLTPKDGKLRAKLYAQDAVLAEESDDAGNYYLTIRMPRVEFEKLFR
ncbi:MAG: GTPase HflX [Gammaproteobacteria bacterium]|nr:GTPase HflX [Gammaproteobacteria bacterium]